MKDTHEDISFCERVHKDKLRVHLRRRRREPSDLSDEEKRVVIQSWIVRLTNQPHQPTQAIYQATYPNSVQPSHSPFSEIEIINKKIFAQAFSVFSFLYKKQVVLSI